MTRRPRGGSIRGVVKDADGQPVAGAQVVSNHDTTGKQREATTNSQGEFALNDVAAGYAGYQIYVQAKGFAPDHFVVEPAKVNSPEAIGVTLMRGHTLRGRVVDENGRPKQGVHVSPGSAAYPRASFGRSVETDEDGGFALDSLPADARFDVFAPNYARLMGMELKLDGGEPVTIALDAPGVVRGRVVDAATGRPVRQFRVTLGFCAVTQPNDPKGTYDSKWNVRGMTVNSAEGKFLFTPLTNGMPVALTVVAQNYEKAIVGRTVAAKAGAAEELVVSLEPADLTQRYALRVQLLDHLGRPAAGTQLRLIVSTKKATGERDNRFNWVLIHSGQLGQKPYCEQFLSGVTDGDGEVDFKHILPGKHLQLVYWGEGVPQGRSFDFAVTTTGGSEVAVIKLPQPARVRVKIQRDRFANAASVRLSAAGGAFHEYELKLAEDQNTFEFVDLPPGEYWVSVGSTPMEFTENGQQFFRISGLASQKIQLQPGETKEVAFTEPDAKKE
ncbi:MAG: carboxypeptidase regulatory-like domain-containing protein [Pirellulales bacterium]